MGYLKDNGATVYGKNWFYGADYQSIIRNVGRDNHIRLLETNSEASLEYPYQTFMVYFDVLTRNHDNQGMYLVNNPLDGKLRPLFTPNPTTFDVKVSGVEFEKLLDELETIGKRIAGVE